MTIGKTLAAAAAIASLASSPAFAGTATRSASALPDASAAPAAQKMAPVSQVRYITKSKKKASDLVQTVVIPIIVGGVVVGYATYELVTDDSPG